MVERVALGWDDITRDAERLAETARADGPWKGIVAVARGGLVPAGLLSRFLEIHLVETVCMSSYDGNERGPLRLIRPPAPDIGDGADWLLVDDLVDTGATMAEARRLLPKARACVLYAKPPGQKHADHFVRAFPAETWLDFPWEVR